MSKKRPNEQLEVDDTCDVVDHISNLPDCIIHHILSFMPTEDAVKTSLLSKRWVNLWASVPNIDIDDIILLNRNVQDVSSFVNFVERVLRDASNMKKFHLYCRFFGDASQIHSWIYDAIIMHNVRELDLSLFKVYSSSVIPWCMFRSTSLVSLKIAINCDIKLPSHVSFPCLKTLHLSYVKFLHHDFTEKLFAGCPVLEKLILFSNGFKTKITISSSTLKSLTIHDFSGVRAFEGPTCGCNIKIDAASLTYFEYVGLLSNKIILNDTPSLEKSLIIIQNHGDGVNEVANKYIDLLKQLRYVMSLTLIEHTVKPLLLADNSCFPVFRNLTHLILTMVIGMEQTFRVLMHFLSSCPVLQSICFSEGFEHCMHLGENYSIWSSIPICMSNCLKTMTFRNFHGYDSEVCFLKFVLKYANVLERMDIWWYSKTSRRPDLMKKTELRFELETCQRSSTACVIKFF